MNIIQKPQLQKGSLAPFLFKTICGLLLTLNIGVGFAADSYSVIQLKALSFGKVYPLMARAGGSVTVSPIGMVSNSAGFRSARDAMPASFLVTGVPNSEALVQVSVPTLQLSSQGLQVKDFTSSLNNWVCQFDAKGECNFTIGATLVIPTGYQGGQYNGTLVINVNPINP